MQFSQSRREFLWKLFSRRNGNPESTSGLEATISDEEPRMYNGIVDRRDVVTVLVAGLAGGIAAKLFPSYVAEAKARPRRLAGTTSSLDKQGRMFRVDNLSMLYDKDLKPNSVFIRNKRLVKVKRDTGHYYLNGVEHGNDVTRP